LKKHIHAPHLGQDCFSILHLPGWQKIPLLISVSPYKFIPELYNALFSPALGTFNPPSIEAGGENISTATLDVEKIYELRPTHVHGFQFSTPRRYGQ
jgi:hypothetical protein